MTNMDSEPTTEVTIYDELGQHWIMLDVCEPVTITAKEGFARSQSFTTYLIRIETNHYGFKNQFTAVRRRYSEFCWLRAMLQKRHPKLQLPTLPPKKYLNLVRFAPKIIEIRRAGLSRFLQTLLESPIFIRETVLHLFLQTDLSIEEMEDKLNQRLSISVNSNSSGISRERYAATLKRTNSIPNCVTATQNEQADELIRAPSCEHFPSTISGVNPLPPPPRPFNRSFSLSGSESGTTSGEVPSINSSAATDQSSTHYFRKSRLMPESMSHLLMFNCP